MDLRKSMREVAEGRHRARRRGQEEVASRPVFEKHLARGQGAAHVSDSLRAHVLGDKVGPCARAADNAASVG